MALTFTRWTAAALVGCALIWFGVLFRSPEHDRSSSEAGVLGRWYYRSTPARAIERRLGQANDRLRLLELRDSVVRTAAATRGAGLAVAIDRGLAPETRARIDSAITSHWTALRIPPGRPVVVAVIVDTVRKPHGLQRFSRSVGSMPIETFLPRPSTGGACVALLHLGFSLDANTSEYVRQRRRNLTSPETIDAVLSPCAYYAAFGEPGPSVARWLTSSRWNPSKLAAWNEAPSPWKSVINDRRFLTTTDALSLTSDPAWAIRKYVAPEGIACLAAERGACRKVLIGPPSIATDSAWRANVVSSSGTSVSSFYLPQRPTPLGPGDGWIVSEMVRTLGPERFAKFWTSPLPVAEAFQQAAGEDIDNWMRGWARRMYGLAAVGPVVSGVGFGTGVLAVVAGFCVAAVIGIRRRVI